MLSSIVRMVGKQNGSYILYVYRVVALQVIWCLVVIFSCWHVWYDILTLDYKNLFLCWLTHIPFIRIYRTAITFTHTHAQIYMYLFYIFYMHSMGCIRANSERLKIHSIQGVWGRLDYQRKIHLRQHTIFQQNVMNNFNQSEF